MQIRPELKDSIYLNKQFIGTTSMGEWQVWISMGNYIDFQGGRNTVHMHSYYEACLALEGEGKFQHGSEVRLLKQGDLFIADPAMEHEIISSEKNHLKIQFISFSFQKSAKEKNVERENETNGLYDQYIASFINYHSLLSGGCEQLESQFKQLSTISKIIHSGEWHLQSESIARNLVLNIILFTLQKEIQTIDTEATDSRLQIALRYMQDNSMRKLTVDEIAGQACTSTRTLRRLIKNHCGKTVIGISLEIRIKESARYLVANPKKSIAEVSYHFGFENPSDFGRKFKQIMKNTPGRFRENQGTAFL